MHLNLSVGVVCEECLWESGIGFGLESQSTPMVQSAEEYARQIARVVVGQLAEQAGYESVQESSIDVLSELLLRYLEEVAAGAHLNAELATRTEINVLDALQSIRDMSDAEDVGSTTEQLSRYLDTLSPVRDLARDLPMHGCLDMRGALISQASTCLCH